MVRSFPGRPFLQEVQIKRFQAKYKFWPPPDASPVIAIEPWGKQFFVYNGIPNVEVKGDARAPDWGAARPRWWREEIALSLQRPGENPNEILTREDVPEHDLNSVGNMTQTHLCVTDFRRRPLLYLSMEELKTVRANLESIKSEIEKFKQTLRPENPAHQLDQLNYQLEDNKYMHIRRGRIMNPPQRSGRGVMSAPNRAPRSRPKK